MRTFIRKTISISLFFLLSTIFQPSQTVYATNESTIYESKDYSAVYNFQFYIGKYPDLKMAFGNNPRGALGHFVNFGMAEGRQGSEGFDVHFYKNTYRDLQAAYGNNNKVYYNHYIKYGRSEGRFGSFVKEGVDYSAVFNIDFYVNKYEDIKRAFGNNASAIFNHFVNYGMAEGRQGSENFNVQFYKNTYRDLQAAFGNDNKAYYNHYVKYGRSEGRLGSLAYQGVDYTTVFNANYYIDKYGDIKRAYGNNASAIFNHFVKFGMAEGRQGSKSFNPQFYKNAYFDLQNIYGNNMKSYYEHFIRYGKNEGRLGVSSTELEKVIEYEITQYGNKDGNQSMFYTIQDITGRLIIIDGGYVSDSTKVREVIAEKGNVVDCWILTHPHPDHIGAFNSIFANPDGIVIKSVYTIYTDYEKFKNVARSWDDIVTLETFYGLTNGNNIQYLKQGDTINLLGLKLKVYNAYADYVPVLTSDLFNDGSLMFEIEGKVESMLFCSDVGIRLSDTIISKYGQELKADYIQMGHHGNGGLSDEFYRLVNPKIAFFDAPDWLMNNIVPGTGERGPWTTPEKKALMESMGTQIYSFSTSPNKIILK